MGDSRSGGYLSKLIGGINGFLRSFLFQVLSHGPMPNHIAFILDGNRRYGRKWNLKEGEGYRAGFLALMSMLKYCYEIGAKYVTIFAFSIDNFKREPDEIRNVMDLMQEKIEGLLQEESIVNTYGIKVDFLGDLKLLTEPIRVAAEKAMVATAGNTGPVLLICAAYSSTDEITRAVRESCREKWAMIEEMPMEMDDTDDGSIRRIGANELDGHSIPLADLERHFYFGKYPDPEILIRTSGENRMSNFILWQSTFCYLSNPKVLWPEISLWHLVWAILQYQRVHPHLEKKKKKLL